MINISDDFEAKRPQTKMATSKTATNKTATNKNGHKLKWPQINFPNCVKIMNLWQRRVDRGQLEHWHIGGFSDYTDINDLKLDSTDAG